MSRPLKNATLRQLATFQTLARLGSVARTAEAMHLTQPAVSLQLGILEESAGTPLLLRGVRGVRLTEAGQLLVGYSERILTLWREAGEAMAAQRGHVAGTLRVGAVTTAEYLLPQLLLDFVREHPEVQVNLQVGNRAQTVGQLATQEVDLAIMGRAPPELKVVASPFARHPMAFVTAPHHPLMALAEPTLHDINGANLLLRERGSGTRTAAEQLFAAAQVNLRLGGEMSSNEAIKQMCAAGFGVAFLSLHACVQELQSGRLAQVPIAGHPLMRDWYVIALDGRPLPAAAKAFSAYLQEHGQARVNARLAMREPVDLPSPARRGRARPRPTGSEPRATDATPLDALRPDTQAADLGDDPLDRAATVSSDALRRSVD